MKVARVSPGAASGIKVGFVDEARSQVLDASQVCTELQVPIDASTAVEVVRYNTETEGSLSRALINLSDFGANRWPIDSVTFHAPIESGSLRDFIAFKQHISTVLGVLGKASEIPAAWYEMPVYYKGNYRTLMGHEQLLYWPRFTEQLDYELELACVVGTEGIGISEENAPKHIGGYCIMNDWSARDIQLREGSVGMGPSKGKDFGTSLGPWLVTPDEFDGANARMVARIDGEVWSDGKFSDIHWSFAQMIAHVSMDERVYPGDILGSGTVGGGCGLELNRWLKPGNVVELEITGLGVLRNRVVRVFK